MKKCPFQLTYAVCPNGDDKQHAADKARQRISAIEDWRVVVNLEATLVGSLEIASMTSQEKRHEAESYVYRKIKDALQESELFYDVRVWASLMVDGLGEPIQINL
ncbi:MAG: hypothetical protein VXW65_09780 [Pseudomonadota bacterium]|nr:hypothetical protein [Pseudomonadota bacterium]